MKPNHSPKWMPFPAAFQHGNWSNYRSASAPLTVAIMHPEDEHQKCRDRWLADQKNAEEDMTVATEKLATSPAKCATNFRTGAPRLALSGVLCTRRMTSVVNWLSLITAMWNCLAGLSFLGALISASNPYTSVGNVLNYYQYGVPYLGSYYNTGPYINFPHFENSNLGKLSSVYYNFVAEDGR